MSTYVNDLRLEEIGTGERSGTWGTATNTSLELIGEALGFGTEAITTNADTHTTTVADGATDPGRAIFLKYTGTLDSACTITIAPNTMSRLHFIENGTSGSQNIIISQGSGASITIPPGDVKAVYLDGAGSGAAVVDAFASLSVVDLKVQDDLTVTDDVTIGGTLGVTGILTCTDDIIIGDGKTIGSASDVDAMTIAANGQITLTQTLIGTALDISGDIDIDGTSNLDIVDIDGAVDMASTLTVAGVVDITDTTDASDATGDTGALRTEGGASIAKKLFVGTDLDVDGTANLDVVDIDGAVDMASTLAVTGIVTLTDDLIIGDGKTIGSASDVDAMTIAANGQVTFTQTLIGTALDISGDIDVDGTTNLDVVDIDGAVDMASTLQVDGGITTSAEMNINTTSAGDALSLTCTEAGADSGPNLTFTRVSSSAADNDRIGDIHFTGRNDADQAVEYVALQSDIEDASDGAEDGRFTINTITNGSAVTKINVRSYETSFNEGAADVNFRVESTGNQNMLKVDAGDDIVLVAGSTDAAATSALFVDGTISHDGRVIPNSSAGNGSASVPSILPGFDYDTGFFLASSGIIGITTAGTERARVDGSGNIMVGRTASTTTTADAGLVLSPLGFLNSTKDGTSTTAHIVFRNNADSGGTSSAVGSITSSGSNTAYNTSSDYRLKENVTYSWDATTRLKQLKPARFNFISDSSNTLLDGFLAHEVSSVVPEAIIGDKDGTYTAQDELDGLGTQGQPNYQGIDHSKLVPLLVKTIQELEARIAALES